MIYPTFFLKPRVCVSYTREAYTYSAGNVRITFDSDIRTSLFTQDFLSADKNIPAADAIILEVKYDAFLPSVISDIIQSDARLQAFSKYGACRRFG